MTPRFFGSLLVFLPLTLAAQSLEERTVPMTVASLTWNPAASFQTNAVITAASSDGSVNIVVDFPTDVVVDINGYYAAPTNAGGDTALGTGALAGEDGSTYNTAFGDGAPTGRPWRIRPRNRNSCEAREQRPDCENGADVEC
jgi:hypothetical protein